MSTISYLAFNYSSFDELFRQYKEDKSSFSLLTHLFYNYAECTWSSSLTHGVTRIHFADKEISVETPLKAELTHMVVQTVNWVMLGTLFAFQPSVAIPILALTLAGKLYHTLVLNSQLSIANDHANQSQQVTDQGQDEVDQSQFDTIQELPGLSEEQNYVWLKLPQFEIKQIKDHLSDFLNEDQLNQIERDITWVLDFNQAYPITCKKLNFMICYLIQKAQLEQDIELIDALLELSNKSTVVHKGDEIKRLYEEYVKKSSPLENYFVLRFYTYFFRGDKAVSTLSSFIKVVTRDINDSNLNTTGIQLRQKLANGLREFQKTQLELREDFGFYNKGLDNKGWYKKAPSDKQKLGELPFLSEREVVYLLLSLGLVSKQEQASNDCQKVDF
ncbi:hypothetical protein [Simkania sp.]|uniref:hypothetical protein n=1 Tax=Simkania sp. TaxID=34094 RepID=UPI003B522DF5